jgi:6-phosphogluconolactonase
LTQITCLADAEAVAAHAAAVVAEVVNGTTEPVHVALAGGTTPERCHELLAPLVGDWSHVHVWLSDERAVAPDDDDSNFKMIKRSLLDRIDIPAENVHRVLGEEGADEAADAYEAEIRAVVPAGPDGVPAIDVIMAGMGPDGHTLSLFPGHPEVMITDRLVVGLHDSPKPPPDRITFTLALIAAAPRTILLVAGEGKREAAARCVSGPDPATPASMLAVGNLEIVLDEAAAAV